MSATNLRLPPSKLLACPRCSAKPSAGLQCDQQFCQHCGTQFFDLSGLPCWFPSGTEQRKFWASLLATVVASAQANLTNSQESNLASDLLPTLRDRLTRDLHVNQQIVESVIGLFADAGLQPEHNAAFSDKSSSDMLQYYELLLRDWAWDNIYSPGEESENQAALRRVVEAATASGKPDNWGDTLVLGAGCGRLSWDIHRTFQPSCTLAVDINPLLIQTAHRLIAQQRPWELPEKAANSQAGLPDQQVWRLEAPGANPETVASWFALAADAWAAPLQKGAFDVVVTPWFIDVCSRDLREVIGLVAGLLKPGGLWLNTGPLLYSQKIPLHQRYNHEEIVELVALAGFSFEHHGIEVVNYLNSPLTAQQRAEQVWTFSARAPAADYRHEGTGYPPAWLQLPHLPIPANISANHQNQPVLIHLLSLVDGQTSINQIAAVMAPNLGPDQDAVGLVKTVFGQMLTDA